jgi:hypothetical protein
VPNVRADDGAHIVTAQQLSDRALDITIDSPAVGRQVPVRMLLPARASRTRQIAGGRWFTCYRAAVTAAAT